MDLNKITADLDFIGNSIKSIKVSNNLVNLGKDIKYSFGLDVNINRLGENEDNGLIGYVELSVTVTVNSTKVKKLKSKIEVLIEGCFSTPSLSKEDFIPMLFVNGGSTLYSIARSLILNISANTYQNGKIVLPMVNMVQYLKEKIEEESQATTSKDQLPESADPIIN
ncbi:hypothetical protein [Faecalispora anaeroviscerum]|uniref:hypothetical protein n=1 Tax=Faecalispora anaeroviscerum TaxID=2991836 RepID=UPI0024BA9232|nr:hypothetical protein [Faecalispora anaeroviscerum]